MTGNNMSGNPEHLYLAAEIFFCSRVQAESPRRCFSFLVIIASENGTELTNGISFAISESVACLLRGCVCATCISPAVIRLPDMPAAGSQGGRFS